MGGASLTTSTGAMALYHFASLNKRDDDDNSSLLSSLRRRENRSLGIVVLWFIAWELGFGLGSFRDPTGNTNLVWFVLSLILWLNPSTLIFLRSIRKMLSPMPAIDISSYLFSKVLVVGLSSLTPMLYLGLETLRCLKNVQKQSQPGIMRMIYVLEFSCLNSPSAYSCCT